MQELIKAEHSDLLLPLHRIGRPIFWNSWARPEHFTLTEAYSIDVLSTDLQDQPTIHHVQKVVCVELLFFIHNLGRAREQHLVEVNRAKQVHLLRCRFQVTIVKPATLRVTDSK